MKAAASKPFARMTHTMARRAGVPDPSITWELERKPIFDNVVATLHIDGRDADADAVAGAARRRRARAPGSKRSGQPPFRVRD